MVSPKRMDSFWDVSQAILCGVSGINGLGIRILSTSSMNFLGDNMPGSVTTGSPSLYPISSTSLTRSLSFISSLIFVYPNRQPYTASVVWRGFRQVQTFMRSTFSTVSLVVNMTPVFSSPGRPLGNASSITRYSASSALTKGAT